MRRKGESGRRVAGAVRSLVNGKGLHESLHVPVMQGSETIIWKGKRVLGLGLYRWITSEVC